MKMIDRPLAFTDVETTGLNPHLHEIIEIGLLVVEPKNLTVVDQLNLKIKPEHIETATPEALAVNGYNEAEWQEAIALTGAMKIYSQKTKDAIFFAHNVTMDWGFMSEAFRKTGVPDLMDYHRLDVLSMAWIKLQNKGLEELKLKAISKFLGLGEEPLPHRALNGARLAYEIHKRLLAM